MKVAVVVAASLCIGAAHAAAQTCGWDADELRDGMPVSLTALVERSTETARIPDGLLEDMRSWIQSCDHTRARVAAQNLRRAAERHRNDPVVSALLGVVQARGPEVQVERAEGYVFRATHPNSNAEKDAVRRLVQVSRQTKWPEVAEELGRLALGTRGQPVLRSSAALLADLAGEHPPLWLLLAEVELARGDYDAAIAAANRAAEHGSNGASRVIGIATIVKTQGSSGAQAYLDGTAAADAGTLQRYYEDMVPILTREETEDWRQTPVERRGAWLRKAWEWRASIATLSPSARLGVHFARMDEAVRRYRRVSFRTADLGSMWLNDLMPPLVLDDRGIVYIRHGDADRVLRVSVVANKRWDGTMYPAFQREAWLYARLAGGRAILEFDKSPHAPDWFLADPSSGACIDPSARAAMAHPNYLRYREDLAMFGAVAAPGEQCYSSVAGDSSANRFWSGPELRQMTAHSVMQTETAEPRMSKPLDVTTMTYAFRAGFRTELMTYMWARADGLAHTTTAAGVQYALPVFTAAEDAAARTVTRADTVIRLVRPQPFARGDGISAAVRLLTEPAASASIRVGLRNDADTTQGQILVTRREVPAFMPGAFATSDIVLASRTDGPWRRGASALDPLPGHVISQGSPFRIFYELYGVTAEEPIRIQVVIAPGGASGAVAMLRNLIARRGALDVSFTDTAELDGDGVARVMREVGADLEPGSYMLRVTTTRMRTNESVQTFTPLHVR